MTPVGDGVMEPCYSMNRLRLVPHQAKNADKSIEADNQQGLCSSSWKASLPAVTGWPAQQRQGVRQTALNILKPHVVAM